MKWVRKKSAAEAITGKNVKLVAMRWSRIWGWTIQRDDDLPYLAKGNAPTLAKAKREAETMWRRLIIAELAARKAYYEY